MPPIISIRNLTKTYASGFQALKGVDQDIRRGEIFALLGQSGYDLRIIRRERGRDIQAHVRPRAA